VPPASENALIVPPRSVTLAYHCIPYGADAVESLNTVPRFLEQAAAMVV
jgi:hypothetical protein